MPLKRKPLNAKLREAIQDIIKENIADAVKVIEIYEKAVETFNLIESEIKENKEFSEQLSLAKEVINSIMLCNKRAEKIKKDAEELLKTFGSNGLNEDSSIHQEKAEKIDAKPSPPVDFVIGKINDILRQALVLELQFGIIKRKILDKQKKISAELQSRLIGVQACFTEMGSSPEVSVPSSSPVLVQQEQIKQKHAQEARPSSEESPLRLKSERVMGYQ